MVRPLVLWCSNKNVHAKPDQASQVAVRHQTSVDPDHSGVKSVHGSQRPREGPTRRWVLDGESAAVGNWSPGAVDEESFATPATTSASSARVGCSASVIAGWRLARDAGARTPASPALVRLSAPARRRAGRTEHWI